MNADAGISSHPLADGAPTPGRGPLHALPGGVHVTLAAGDDAPTLARRAAVAALAGWEPSRRDAALLVVSELVTNAVRHGSRDDRDRVELSIRRTHRGTRIEVVDGHARGGPGPALDGTPRDAARRDAGTQRSGWGLPIVAELTDRRGVEGAAHRTRVWCEIDDP